MNDNPTLDCPGCCRTVTPALSWRPLQCGRWHLEARCSTPHCRRWLRWVPQVEPWISMAPLKVTSYDEIRLV